MPNGLVLVFLLVLGGCSAMRYELSSVPFPVHAKANAYGDGEPFELESKYVMYGHGLFGHEQPRVAELLREHCQGARAVSDFRVTATTSLWDWLGTHLSLGFVRLKTVTISGQISR